MMERKERKPYWRHTKWQMLASVLPFLVLIIVLPLYADASTTKRFLGFPLGYFLAPRHRRHRLLHGCQLRQPPGRHRSLARRARGLSERRSDHGAVTDLAHPASSIRGSAPISAFSRGLRWPARAAGADVRAARHHRHRCCAAAMLLGPLALYAAIGLLRADARGARLLRLRAAACPPSSTALCSAIATLGRHRLPRHDRRVLPRRLRRAVPGASAGAPASSSWRCCWRRSCASSAPSRCRAISGGASRAARAVVAAALLAVPALLLLAAEAALCRLRGSLAARPVRAADGRAVVVACVVAHRRCRRHALADLVERAQAIAALLALAVPATIVAVMVSNLPLPQMTHGNILRALARTEALRNLPDHPGAAVRRRPAGRRPRDRSSSASSQAFGSVGGMASF